MSPGGFGLVVSIKPFRCSRPIALLQPATLNRQSASSTLFWRYAVDSSLFGPVEAVLVLVVAVVVLGPPVTALVAMRRSGRGWARTRLISYSLSAILYAINSVAIFSSGNAAGGGASAIIAWFSGKGAISAWRAWRRGDFRPAYLRKQEPGTAQSLVSDGRAPDAAA